MFEKIQKLIKTIFLQEYARASIYYIIANIIGQGIVLVSSAVFTRMMSKNDYGLVSTYSTWVLVLNSFICMNLFITVRNAYIDFRDDYDTYNSSVLMLSIFTGIILTLVITVVVGFEGMPFGIWEVVFACLQSVALNIVNYMLAIQSMKNEYRQRAILMIIPNWTHVFLSVALMMVFVQNMYMAKIAGNAIGLMIFGVICAFVIFRRKVPRIIPKYWQYALRISVPSIFNTLSDLILMQCDRLMLTSMAGAEETAEYSVIYNVSSIIVAIYQAANGAWVPWFYKMTSKHDRVSTRKYQSYYMILFTLFTCGMMTVSPELIKLISPHSYWEGIRYVGPIVVASYLIFLYAFLTVYLMYEKRTERIAVNTIIAAVLNVLLNYLLIAQYKSVGAVLATVISYIVLFLLHYFSVGREGKEYLSTGAMWMNLLMVCGYGIVFYFVKDLWLIRYAIFICGFIVLYMKWGKRIVEEFAFGRK